MAARRNRQLDLLSVQRERSLPHLQERHRNPVSLQHGVLPDGGLHDLCDVEERGPPDEPGSPPRGSEADPSYRLPGWDHLRPRVRRPGPRSRSDRLHSLPGVGEPAAASPHRLPHVLRLPFSRHARHVSLLPGWDAGPQAGEEGERRGTQPHAQPGRDPPGGCSSGPARPVLLLPGGGPGRGDPGASGGARPVLLPPQPAGARPPEHLHH